MARRRKNEKIAEIKVLPNVFENPLANKGKWHEVFGNNNPITAEIGCGKGAYTLNLARKFPDSNFIGIDIKGPRIWTGAKAAIAENLHNAAFARMQIEFLTEAFGPNEISEIWITFPDPYPKISKEKRRLIAPRFLQQYKQALAPGGIMHFKSDNEGLYEYGMESLPENKEIEVLANSDNLYESPLLNELTSIKTAYETRFLAEGKTIKYIKFRFRE